MRFNLRIKVKTITFFAMLSQTQTVVGITSLIKNLKDVRKNKHILFWDIENTTFKNTILNLFFIQQKYNLGEIFIFGDSTKGKTFNAMCFTVKPFNEYLKILLDTSNIDYLFFKYTVMRGKATVRLTNKKNRKEHKLLHTILGRKEKIPPFMQTVIYDTGLMKHGKSIELVHDG